MSLVGVFSPLTVEPNNPSWHTPTARRGAFSVERILMTVLFFIYFVFVVSHGGVTVFSPAAKLLMSHRNHRKVRLRRKGLVCRFDVVLS